MEIKIIKEKITKSELKQIAVESFGDMVKGVVDMERKLMAIGEELHADGEQILLADGSRQENLWGINIYPDRAGKDRVEFESLINIRPQQNNRSTLVQDAEIRKQIFEIVSEFLP